MRELVGQAKWIVIGGALLIGGALAYGALRAEPLPSHPLALAPRDAQIVAHVDVDTVMRSHLFEVLVEEDEGADVRRVESTCGFDPLAQVEQAVIFVAGAEERPFEHVGFVARGEMARGGDARERLVRCVRDVIGGRGGAVRETEVEGLRAMVSAHGRSVAAFLGEDGVVGGDPTVVAQSIRATRGQAPSAASDAELRALWDRVAEDRDAVVVARIPPSWLPSLARVARALEGDLEALAAIRTLAVGVRVRRGIAIRVAAQTTDRRAADRLDDALGQQIDRLLEDRSARLSVLGSVLRSVETEARAEELRIDLAMTDGQLDGILELWRELRAQGAEPGAEPEPGVETESGAESESESEVETEAESDSEDEPASESDSESGSDSDSDSDSEGEAESGPASEPASSGAQSRTSTST